MPKNKILKILFLTIFLSGASMMASAGVDINYYLANPSQVNGPICNEIGNQAEQWCDWANRYCENGSKAECKMSTKACNFVSWVHRFLCG